MGYRLLGWVVGEEYSGYCSGVYMETYNDNHEDHVPDFRCSQMFWTWGAIRMV